MNVFPAKVTLKEDKDILASPAGILSNHIDRYIWPGPMPATIEDTLKICTQEIMFNNADISSALQKAEDSINNDLESIDFQAVENLYKYADEL
jgi:multiple sugar transport system substrate-binding protein